MTIRVGLVDDHRIVLEGLAQLLSLEEDIEVVFKVDDGRTAIEATRRHAPDVLVADIRMPGMDGLEVLSAVRAADTATVVVLLTAHISDTQVLEAVRHGVGGIVLKEAAPRTLVQCVRMVAAGERWIDQRTMHAALESVMKREAGLARAAKVLTRRELEIVRMVAAGMRNKEIASKLAISEGTVKIHIHSIYEKLQVTGRVDLTNYARENELL